MMDTKTIGIVGGMGPEATLSCFEKVIKNTPAKTDQQHIRVVIDSNPKVPDRTAAIIGNGESPVPSIVHSCHAVEMAGADFIIIPCVSAHFFLSEIQKQIDLPILSIFDAVAETITREYHKIRTVGLMATTGTVTGGLFQRRLAKESIKTVVPETVEQSEIMEAIYNIKNSERSRSMSEITTRLIAVAKNMIYRKHDCAEAIVAGCTEIPLALRQEHISVPYFDSLTILARSAILYAGKIPAKLL